MMWKIVLDFKNFLLKNNIEEAIINKIRDQVVY